MKNPWIIPEFGGFHSHPRTAKEAKFNGWKKIEGCETAEVSGFEGERYAQPDKKDIVLLYDVNGYIAGKYENN